MAIRNSFTRLLSSSRPGARALLALAGLWWLPGLVIVDGLWARRGGWQPNLAWQVLAIVVIAGASTATISLLFRPTRRWWGGRVAQFWMLSVSTLLALVGTELGLRKLGLDRLFPRRLAGHVYKFEPDVALFPGVSPVARYAVNSRGLRGPELPQDEATYRILCVGGSTTECLYVDDPQTWPAQLMQKLSGPGTAQCWVGNAGLSGDGVKQLWDRLRHGDAVGEVDCVVTLLSGDDLMRAILRLDEQPVPALPRRLLCAQLLLGSGEAQPTRLADRTGVELTAARDHLSTQSVGLNWGPPLERFSAYVRQVAHVVRRENRRLIYVTQPVLWDDLLPSLGTRRLHLMRNTFEAGAADKQPPKFDQVTALAMSDHFNKRLTDACRELDIECVDAARRMNGRTHFFYDDLHLNDAGCAELARLLAEHLRAHPDRRWLAATAEATSQPAPPDAR